MRNCTIIQARIDAIAAMIRSGRPDRLMMQRSCSRKAFITFGHGSKVNRAARKSMIAKGERPAAGMVLKPWLASSCKVPDALGRYPMAGGFLLEIPLVAGGASPAERENSLSAASSSARISPSSNRPIGSVVRPSSRCTAQRRCGACRGRPGSSRLPREDDAVGMIRLQ